MKSPALSWFHIRKMTLHLATANLTLLILYILGVHEAFARRVKTTYHPRHSLVQFLTDKIRGFHCCHAVSTVTRT